MRKNTWRSALGGGAAALSMLAVCFSCSSHDGMGTQKSATTSGSKGESATACDGLDALTSNGPRTLELWPPNHRLERITTDDCVDLDKKCSKDVLVKFLWATSDEAEDAAGDGHHVPDIEFVACDSVDLRVERDGRANGRVYTLGFRVWDAAGHSTDGVCKIEVPHDQGKHGRAVEDAPMLTVENSVDCPAAPKPDAGTGGSGGTPGKDGGACDKYDTAGCMGGMGGSAGEGSAPPSKGGSPSIPY